MRQQNLEDTTEISCAHCIRCPKRNVEIKNFDLSKWLILRNRTSELLSCRDLPPINHQNWHWISNFETDTFRFRSCLQLFDVSLNSHKSSWLIRNEEFFEAVLKSCWVVVTILRAGLFYIFAVEIFQILSCIMVHLKRHDWQIKFSSYRRWLVFVSIWLLQTTFDRHLL